MKNKLKMIFLSGLILSLGGCTNIQDRFTGIQDKLAGTPIYTEIEKNNFNVQEETQLFAMGSSKVNESGTAVAKMKAEEQAKTDLKKLIFNETTNILNSFFDEINSKSIVISKNTIEDLSNLISSELIKEAVTTNSWNNEGKEFIVLAIDKNKIPEKAKTKFSNHLQTIIDDLDKAITKVSNEYLEIANPPVEVLTEETPQSETIDEAVNTEIESSEKSTESSVSSESVEDSNLEKNAEPEVFLDDF